MDQNMLMNILVVIPIVLMFVFMTISQKKKSKKEQELRNSVKVGDEIITIGGIVGTVISVSVADESFVIESQNVKFKIKKWSIASVRKGE